MAIMSIWKAPQSVEKQQAVLKHGVRAQDVDNPLGRGHCDYGFVFFAETKEDAAHFAYYYGAGIIEFRIDSADYARLNKTCRPFAEFEQNEVLVPYSELEAFNRYVVERRLHK
ncbi:MAG TPA: hypothetical protein VKX17_25840 [Planctomycetota bacterium]|nr:hypothetical protein [Planctomycetota bacterium]